MKLKLVLCVVAVVALLIIAACSKQVPAPSNKPAPVAPAQQDTAPQIAAATQLAHAAATQTLQNAPGTPPELAQADQTVQDLSTSDLDQASKDTDALAVP